MTPSDIGTWIETQQRRQPGMSLIDLVELAFETGAERAGEKLHNDMDQLLKPYLDSNDKLYQHPLVTGIESVFSLDLSALTLHD